MKLAQIYPLLVGLNASLLDELFNGAAHGSNLASASSYSSNGPTMKKGSSCFGGSLRGESTSGQALIQHIMLQSKAKQAEGVVAVGWVLDDDIETKEEDLPVVIAIGINYGQGEQYLTKPVRWRDSTQMRPRLKKAGVAFEDESTQDCVFTTLPRRFHLIAGNFFPWITRLAWGDHHFNGIEEAMLFRCFGFKDPYASLNELLTGAIGKAVTHLFFHGTNSPVPTLGVQFLSQYPTVLTPTDNGPSIQVVFSDNLARPYLPISNSVALCLERTGYDQEDVMGLGE